MMFIRNQVSLPGQPGKSGHADASSGSPYISQVSPPYCGMGFEQSRDRTRVPLPHVVEQVPQELHSV